MDHSCYFCKMLEIFFKYHFKALSDVAFILFTNVKIPTQDCWHFNIKEHDKVPALFSLA